MYTWYSQYVCVCVKNSNPGQLIRKPTQPRGRGSSEPSPRSLIFVLPHSEFNHSTSYYWRSAIVASQLQWIINEYINELMGKTSIGSSHNPSVSYKMSYGIPSRRDSFLPIFQENIYILLMTRGVNQIWSYLLAWWWLESMGKVIWLRHTDEPNESIHFHEDTERIPPNERISFSEPFYRIQVGAALLCGSVHKLCGSVVDFGGTFSRTFCMCVGQLIPSNGDATLYASE